MTQKKRNHAVKASANVQNKSNANIDFLHKRNLLQSEVSEDVRKNENSSLKSTALLSANINHSKHTLKLPNAEVRKASKTGSQQHAKKLPLKNREIIKDYSLSSTASTTQNGYLKNSYQKEDFSINQYKYDHYKYIAETFIWIYFVHSWIYSLMAKNMDVLSVSDNLFRSVEEGLVYKIIWCVLFGIVADLLSWKVSFLAQAVSWAILCFHWVFHYPSIFRLFITICVTSSPLLVSLLAITHIWNKDCMGALCRLGLISRLVPLGVHSCLTVGSVKETSLPQSLFAAVCHGCLFWTDYMKKSGIVLPLICAVSLFAVVLIQSTNGSGHNTGYPSSSTSRRKISTFFHLCFSTLFVEFFIFIPISLWMAFSTSDRDENLWITSLLALVCLWIYSFMIPLCVHLLPSPGTLLTYSCFTIWIVYAFVLILYQEWISAGKLLITLILYATYGIYETAFQAFAITQLKGIVGTVLSTVVSLHLIIHFLLRALLTSELKSFGSKLTPCKVLVSFETSLRTLVEHLFTVLLKTPPCEDSSAFRCSTYCCDIECQSESSILYSEEKCRPVLSFTSFLAHNLPKVDLVEITTLANFGFLASSLALFFIFLYRWKLFF